MILIILSGIITLLYIIISIIINKKIPESISSMVYIFSYEWKYIWTIWLWTISMLLLPSLIDKLGNYWQFLGFLWGISTIFCGALPLIKGEQNQLHNIFGIAAGILSQACVLVLCPWWYICWFIMLIFVMTDKFKDSTSILYDKSCFIAEVICYISLVGSLLSK